MGKHDKDIKDLIEVVLQHGWTEHTRNNYYKFRCPCGQHKKTIKRSPSDPNYCKNTLMWFRRQPCWKEDEQS